jgi:hypothetical protein
LKIRRKIALNNSRVGFYVTLGSSDEDLGESVLGVEKYGQEKKFNRIFAEKYWRLSCQGQGP